MDISPGNGWMLTATTCCGRTLPGAIFQLLIICSSFASFGYTLLGKKQPPILILGTYCPVQGRLRPGQCGWPAALKTVGQLHPKGAGLAHHVHSVFLGDLGEIFFIQGVGDIDIGFQARSKLPADLSVYEMKGVAFKF